MGAEGRVVIVPYDPAWPQHYMRERDAITVALGDILVAIAHVGSTSVPGLAAKPVIDIMPGVAAEAGLDCCVAPLQHLGYAYVPAFEEELPFRRYLRKPARGHDPAVHVHVVVVGTAFWEEHVLFRDYLRAHPRVAAQYAELKRAVAQTVSDRAAYQEAKADFIVSVLCAARGWASGDRDDGTSATCSDP